MVQIIGYGEDAHTFQILTVHLDEVLKKLRDPSEPSDCVLYYRPSFGRGGRSRALLGECDSILLTRHYMYLIESKQSISKELRRGELAKCQRLRHDMITWIAKNWDGRQDFAEFCSINRQKFSKEFVGKDLPPTGSGVYERILNVLSKAYDLSTDGVVRTKNILLIISDQDTYDKHVLVPKGFEPIEMVHIPLDKSGFFRMN